MAKTPRNSAEPAGGPDRATRATCPACGEHVESRDLADDEDHPFCSRRCRLVDLGQWFDGAHRISRPIEIEEE